MTADQEGKLLSPEEKEFVNRLAAHYTPPPLTPAKRFAFDRALEEQMARRARVSFFRPAAVMATACAALLVWFAARYQGPYSSQEGEQPGAVVATREESPPSGGEATLLTYAYSDPEFYGDEDDGDEESFLPDEYQALAVAFNLPDA